MLQSGWAVQRLVLAAAESGESLVRVVGALVQRLRGRLSVAHTDGGDPRLVRLAVRSAQLSINALLARRNHVRATDTVIFSS